MHEPVEPGLQRLRVLFGQAETCLRADQQGVTLALKVPHLAGPNVEEIVAVAGPVVSPSPNTMLLEDDDWLAGVFLRPLDSPLDQLTLKVYQQLLDVTRGWSVCRIWNYMPHINSETTGLENYRRFNLGRWQAYRDAYGDDLHRHLPAASAIGLRDEHVATVFLASRRPVRAIENPDQVPAWSYPNDYGPKAPSFARAAMTGEAGSRWGWISGTASIKGHSSVAPGDGARQLDVTLDNLRLVLALMGFPPLGATQNGFHHRTKVYLRDPNLLGGAQHRLGDEGWAVSMSNGPLFLQAEICRRELEVEIEVALSENGTQAAP
jgi:chorismate lyase/3-hydroxybenzoate synthase